MVQSKRGVDQENDDKLTGGLTAKVNYLTKLHRALTKRDDVRVYKLLNVAKYDRVMRQKPLKGKSNYQNLVVDLLPRLRHYLSHRLIKYLKKIYPFFYYYEERLGHYQIYFGDWWGHKLFGNLDVIKVKFNFNSTEYEKLHRAFDRKHSNQELKKVDKIKKRNDRLSQLVKTQTKRDNLESELKADLKVSESQTKLPWNGNRIKTEEKLMTDKLDKLERLDKKATDAKKEIKENRQEILEFSKENTVIGYEKQCVKDQFGSLSQFNENNKQLYYNYLSFLINGGKNDHE